MNDWVTPRRHARLQTPGTALLSASGRFVPFAVKNVSAGGVLLAGDAPLPVGDGVQVELLLSDAQRLSTSAVVGSEASLSVEARVNRVEHPKPHCFEVALEFQEASPVALEMVSGLATDLAARDLIGVRPQILMLADEDDGNVGYDLTADAETLGYDVLSAGTPLEALFLLQTPETYVRLAVIMMGSPYALDFVELLAQRYPHVRRALMARGREMASAEQWQLAGWVDVVLGRRWNLWELAASL